MACLLFFHAEGSPGKRYLCSFCFLALFYRQDIAGKARERLYRLMKSSIVRQTTHLIPLIIKKYQDAHKEADDLIREYPKGYEWGQKETYDNRQRFIDVSTHFASLGMYFDLLGDHQLAEKSFREMERYIRINQSSDLGIAAPEHQERLVLFYLRRGEYSDFLRHLETLLTGKDFPFSEKLLGADREKDREDQLSILYNFMNIEGIESEVDYVLKSLSMTESDPDKEAEIHAVHEKAMNMISDFKKRMGEDKNEPIEAMMGATPDDGNSPIEEREMRNILRRSGRNRLMRIFLVSAALFGVPFVAWGVVSLGIAPEALSEPMRALAVAAAFMITIACSMMAGIREADDNSLGIFEAITHSEQGIRFLAIERIGSLKADEVDGDHLERYFTAIKYRLPVSGQRFTVMVHSDREGIIEENRIEGVENVGALNHKLKEIKYKHSNVIGVKFTIVVYGANKDTKGEKIVDNILK